MNWFSSKSTQDDDCAEIQRLSAEITNKITIINDFVKDKGFINQIRLSLTEIRSKIRDFKIKQTTVTNVGNELNKPIPDCKQALIDLEDLKKIISKKDSRIADLERQLQDLSQSQNASLSQQELTKKQNNCKELCSRILADINTKLAAIIPAFQQSGKEINGLLNAINKDLDLSVPPRGYVEMKDMGRGNNGSDKSKDSVSGSNQSMFGRIGNSVGKFFSNKPTVDTNDSTIDSLYNSTSQINGVNPSINRQRSQLKRNDSNGSLNFDTRSRRDSVRSEDSDDYTDYDPNVQFQRSDLLNQKLTPEQLNSFTSPRSIGGYYYSTSTSSSKRNKKSTRNRKKNKKNKKSRR
jgi:hypothetical protein